MLKITYSTTITLNPKPLNPKPLNSQTLNDILLLELWGTHQWDVGSVSH